MTRPGESHVDGLAPGELRVRRLTPDELSERRARFPGDPRPRWQANRRRNRAAGVDRYGRPLPRVAGTNPRSRGTNPRARGDEAA